VEANGLLDTRPNRYPDQQKSDTAASPNRFSRLDLSNYATPLKEYLQLTLERCINMSSTDIDKLNKGQREEMKKLYHNNFLSLYVWEHTCLKKDDVKVKVHYSHLHKAISRKIVYCGINEERLQAIQN
jgi:hypothetical protein